MTIVDRIKTALESTPFPFAHFGWRTEPAGDYGVYAEESAGTLIADDRNAESFLTGYIDLFTRTADDTPRILVENALRSAGVLFWLDSVQFENDTRFVHYEWRWRDV